MAAGPIFGPMTLLEYAKASTNRLTQAVVRLFAENSPILQVLPFETIQGAGYPYNVEEALPGIGFRGINEAWTQSHGVMNPMFEPLVIAGGELDYDNFLERTFGPGRRNRETQNKVRAMSLKWGQVFIKGDAGANPRLFDGLQTRLIGRQRLAAGTTANGDPLSLFKLDELTTLVESPTHFLCSEKMTLRLAQAARNPNVAGYLVWNKNEFGQRVMEWNGLPMLPVMRDETNTDILAFNEACPGGGTNTGTSIYCVSLRPGALMGIQSGPPIVKDLDELESKPAKRIRVEWDNGFVIEHPWSAARLWGVSDAAVVV